MRGRGIDASASVVAPAATLLTLASTTIAELTAVSVTAVRNKASLVDTVGAARFAVTAPNATLSSEASRAIRKGGAVRAVVGEHAASGGSINARLSLFAPSAALQVVASVTCGSGLSTILVAVVTFVGNGASAVVVDARSDGVAPDASLEIVIARLAVSLEAAGASVERSSSTLAGIRSLDASSVA